MRSAISGTAAAASSLLTVTRTSCDPARASADTCAAVAAASAVSVLVMDCTTTGWEDPIRTPPTSVVTVVRRRCKRAGVRGQRPGKQRLPKAIESDDASISPVPGGSDVRQIKYNHAQISGTASTVPPTSDL